MSRLPPIDGGGGGDAAGTMGVFENMEGGCGCVWAEPPDTGVVFEFEKPLGAAGVSWDP